MFADCDWLEVEGMKKDFLDLMSKSHEYFKRFKYFFYVAVPSASLPTAYLKQPLEKWKFSIEMNSAFYFKSRKLNAIH